MQPKNHTTPVYYFRDPNRGGMYHRGLMFFFSSFCRFSLWHCTYEQWTRSFDAIRSKHEEKKSYNFPGLSLGDTQRIWLFLVWVFVLRVWGPSFRSRKLPPIPPPPPPQKKPLENQMLKTKHSATTACKLNLLASHRKALSELWLLRVIASLRSTKKNAYSVVLCVFRNQSRGFYNVPWVSVAMPCGVFLFFCFPVFLFSPR